MEALVLSYYDFELKFDHLFSVLERKPNKLLVEDLYKEIKGRFDKKTIYKVIDSLAKAGTRYFSINDFIDECGNADCNKTTKEDLVSCEYCKLGLRFYESPLGYSYVFRCTCDAGDKHPYTSFHEAPFDYKNIT